MVGNKCDNEGGRKVSKEEGESLARDKNLIFLETSAKNDNNVQKLFYYFLYKLLEYFKNNEYTEENNLVLNQGKTEEIDTKRPNKNKCNC